MGFKTSILKTMVMTMITRHFPKAKIEVIVKKGNVRYLATDWDIERLDIKAQQICLVADITNAPMEAEVKKA